MEKVSRHCSPFNIPETANLLKAAMNVGIKVVDQLRDADTKNFGSSPAPSANGNTTVVSKWKSPVLQLGTPIDTRQYHILHLSMCFTGHIEACGMSTKLFDCASAVLACRSKVDELALNTLCICAMAACAKASKPLMVSAFQLGFSEIMQQLRHFSIFKEMVHMSFSVLEDRSTIQLTLNA